MSTTTIFGTTTTVLVLSTVLLSVLLVPTVRADWDSTCPTGCKCTYASNRKVIKCDRVGFSTIPSNLSPEVQELVLSNNNIKQIDKEELQRAGLVNLQKLILSNNQISYVDKDAFTGLKILIELDLQNNRIEKLHPHTFTGMEKLRYLYLNNNQLTRLDAHQFPELLHLQKLEMNQCNIRFVHNFAFINLPNITNIGLSDNIIESVQPDIFANNKKLLAVEVNNNRWNCDCRLRPFANWMRDHFSNTQWQCYSPARLKDTHWQQLPPDEFACDPAIDASQELVSIAVGSEGTLNCWATGDPIPSLNWVTGGKVLSNLTLIGESTDHYVVYQTVNESTIYSTLELGIFGDHHPTEYSCVAQNPANSVTKTIQVLIGSDPTTEVVVQEGPSVYLLIGIGGALIVLILILIIVICCCYCRRRSSRNDHSKFNGTNNGNVMVVAPLNPVNPIGKPPRQYEKLPQKDVEMTLISSNTSLEGSHHKSFDDLNYSHGGYSTYGELRGRLPPLQEEGSVGLQPNQTYMTAGRPVSPSPTLTLQSDLTGRTTATVPDLLDNARVPRTVSPTNMSYQSLAYPPVGQDWRFSYAQPSSDYGVTGAPASVAGYPVSQPMAYSTPQHQRPGYVTLPRRPRAPSWSGVPSNQVHVVTSPLASQTLPPQETLYDTLGPRTTADGTSTTDLTRPGSRAALYEPLPPIEGNQAAVPTSPAGLASHYNNRAAQKYTSQRQFNTRPGASQTLPRSTPNLLDNTTQGLSIPQYKKPVAYSIQPRSPQSTLSPQHMQQQAPELHALIDDANSLGIPYDPSAPPPRSAAATPLFDTNASLSSNTPSPAFSNSSSALLIHAPPPPTINRSNNNFSPVPHSISSPSPVPHFKPPSVSSSNHQLPPPPPPHSLVSQLDERPSPCTSPSRTPLLNGSNDVFLPPLSPTINNNNNNNNTQTFPGKKKVPPKPPPKPSSKRLSLASVTSDCSTARLSSTGGPYQDEGPDGSEV